MSTAIATDSRTLLGVGILGDVGVGGNTETIPQVEVSDSLPGFDSSSEYHSTVAVTESSHPFPALSLSASYAVTLTADKEDTLPALASQAEVNVVVPTVNIAEALPSFSTGQALRLVSPVSVSDTLSTFGSDSDAEFELVSSVDLRDALPLFSPSTDVSVAPSLNIYETLPLFSPGYNFIIYPYPMSLLTLSDGRRAPVYTYDNIRVPVYIGQHR